MNILDKLKRYYKGSTVLITGHTGFKGGWLSLWLDAVGAKVIGYSLGPPSFPSFFEVMDLSNKIIDIRGDIRDLQNFSTVVQKYQPDYIFHLAAQPLVRKSYQYPLETFIINAIGTANVLESIRISQIQVVCLCITSDKCYENREWEYAYRENDPMGGRDPYSASKSAAEIIIASYRDSFFENYENKPIRALSSTRAGNIIGGGDWAEDRLVPDCIRALSHKRPIKIRNPYSIRPWQFILDPLFGYLVLAIKMKEIPEKYSDAWNFGPYYSNNIDVQTLTNKIIHEWGSGNWENTSFNNTLREACFLKLDIAKSTTKLGWQPIYDIDVAIGKTIDWYKAYYAHQKNMYEYSLNQIQKYMEDVEKYLKM